MGDCSEDLISRLPDNLLCEILSEFSTKEAALTSLLSKRWRHVFALSPNLDFDDFSTPRPHPITGMPLEQTSFIDFVNRVLKLRGKYHVKKFSLRCGDGVGEEHFSFWTSYALEHGASDLSLHHSPYSHYSLSSEIFVSSTLVKLKIVTEEMLWIRLRNVCLPKLKTLYLDSVFFEENQDELDFEKLLSGCPVLEELILLKFSFTYWEYCSVCIPSLKRLTICSRGIYENTKSVSFDTPNVLYFEYSDTIAEEYNIMNFESLVEARISLRMKEYQKGLFEDSSDDDDEIEMDCDATKFLMGICNVGTLYLSDETLETLNFCCEVIPVFNNLNCLTIESSPEIGWKSFSGLLKNCPNLETLVFQGLLHRATNECGDVCLCRGLEIIPSCLSSSPVKILKILKFGETNDYEDLETNMEKIKNFLRKMPNLEKLIIYYNTSTDDNMGKISRQLQMLTEVASSKCEIQIVSDSLNLSFTLPISLSMKVGLIL